MAEIKYLDLTVDNLFDFCVVLDAIGLESVIGVFDKKELAAIASDKDTHEIGVDVAIKIAGVLLKNAAKARNEICGFLAGCMEWDNGQKVTVDELKKFKIGRFVKLVIEFFKKEDLADFFKEVAEFVGTEQPSLKNSYTNGIQTLTNT